MRVASRRIRPARFMIESIHYILGTASQARHTPDGHRRVENHRRPQRHTVQSQAEAGESEESGDGYVVKQQRRDQPSRGAALPVIARKPAGDSQSKQCDPGDATHYDGDAEKFRAEQQPPDERRNNNQCYARGRFDYGGDSQQFVHPASLSRGRLCPQWLEVACDPLLSSPTGRGQRSAC